MFTVVNLYLVSTEFYAANICHSLTGVYVWWNENENTQVSFPSWTYSFIQIQELYSYFLGDKMLLVYKVMLIDLSMITLAPVSQEANPMATIWEQVVDLAGKGNASQGMEVR